MTTLAASLTQSTDRPESPLQVELRFFINAPPAEVFDLVAHRLNEWFSQIHSVSWDHSKSVRGPSQHGACSERSCDFAGKALREVIVGYEPGKRYSYRVDMARSEMKMPLDGHFGSFDLEPVEGGTRVTWRQYFTPKWFVPGALLRWQMRDKLMKPAIERLLEKYSGRWA